MLEIAALGVLEVRHSNEIKSFNYSTSMVLFVLEVRHSNEIKSIN